LKIKFSVIYGVKVFNINFFKNGVTPPPPPPK
jgi:hypothetical protein